MARPSFATVLMPAHESDLRGDSVDDDFRRADSATGNVDSRLGASLRGQTADAVRS